MSSANSDLTFFPNERVYRRKIDLNKLKTFFGIFSIHVQYIPLNNRIHKPEYCLRSAIPNHCS